MSTGRITLKLIHKGIFCEDLGWNNLADVWWLALVNKMMNVRVP
jgi:hypothetical protein